MAGLTRVPYSLLEGIAPIRWIGDETERTRVLGEANEDLDKGFFFLQKNGDGTAQIFALTFSDTNVPSWVEVSGSGGAGFGDITSLTQLPKVLQDELSTKLSTDFNELPASDVSKLADTNIVVGADSNGDPVKISMSQIKDYVDSDADKGWCGYHANLAALEQWVTDYVTITPGTAYWAILADTDTIWVYDHNTNTWKDTGSSTALPITTKIEGGEGITVTGTLADGTVTVSADTTKLVLNTDERLLPNANIIGKGTEAERLALTGTSVDADHVGMFYIQTTGSGSEEYGEFYQLKKAAPNPEWLRIGVKQEEQKGAILIPDLQIDAGSDSITIQEYYSEEDYIFLVFISGILQLKDAFSVTSNKTLQKTTITLAGHLASTMECNVVLLPL